MILLAPVPGECPSFPQAWPLSPPPLVTGSLPVGLGSVASAADSESRSSILLVQEPKRGEPKAGEGAMLVLIRLMGIELDGDRGGPKIRGPFV